MSFLLIMFRFDYIGRDSRACGLGCNFHFQRYASKSIHLILLFEKINLHVSAINFM